MTTLPIAGPCYCKPGIQHDNCPQCKGTGQRIDWPEFHRQKNAGAPYTAADPDTRVPRDPAPRPRVTEAQLAQAEAAARVVKMALTWRATLDYCAGQYWPTEYRAAACAVLGTALFDYFRTNVNPDAKKPGDAIRQTARAELGRGIQSRWID